LKVTFVRSCALIWSSALFAVAIAPFIEASTASGVWSQSGSVRMEFAFAAASRKASAVSRSSPRMVIAKPQKRSEARSCFIKEKRNENNVGEEERGKVEFGVALASCLWVVSATCLHR